jgi:hypothetical protein
MKALKFVLAVSLPFVGLSFPSSPAAQTASVGENNKTGSICVLPNSPEPPTRFSQGGEYNPDTLMVRVDSRESLRWPHKSRLLIDGLDLRQRHLVVLTSDGKRIQSFRFKFSQDDDAKLCMAFDGYQGVQLGNRTNADWCRVKNRDCWR